MSPEDRLSKLRFCCQVISDKKLYLESRARRSLDYIELLPFGQIADEIEELQGRFPGVIPQFVRSDFKKSAHYFDLTALDLYLDRALARLNYELDGVDAIPVTEVRSFAFVVTGDLRRFLERDYPEIQRAFVAGCWKSVVILSGGAIEAILLDLALQNPDEAKEAKNAPREPDLAKWGLSDLLRVCVELGVVTAGVEKLSHSVREFRNLVHPGVEMRKPLVFGKEEARIALEILHMLHRDLSLLS
jgi:hypothetical protein